MNLLLNLVPLNFQMNMTYNVTYVSILRKAPTFFVGSILLFHEYLHLFIFSVK